MVDGSISNETDIPQYRCTACDQFHPIGYCLLKRAGVEHCGLCGIPHFGFSRTCPHLNSETQVAVMLGSLKESTEQRALVEEATKYLRGIRGHLVRRNRLQQQGLIPDPQASPHVQQALAPHNPYQPTAPSEQYPKNTPYPSVSFPPQSYNPPQGYYASDSSMGPNQY